MKSNPDGSLDITVEEAVKFGAVGFALIIEDGKVVAIVEED